MAASDFIQFIQQLCDRLVQSKANPDAIAASLGNIQEEVFQTIRVTPAHDEWLKVIRVNRDATRDGEVSNLVLTLVDALPLAELEAAFGSYKRQRGRSKSPAKAIFGIQAQSDTHTATLMAAIQQDKTDTITIRRDIRLI